MQEVLGVALPRLRTNGVSTDSTSKNNDNCSNSSNNNNSNNTNNNSNNNKGQMGSTLMGSLQKYYLFLTDLEKALIGHFWGMK